MILWLLACSSLGEVEGDAPCREVGYSIAWRTFACTNDPDLANERHALFEEQYECIEVDFPTVDVDNQYLLDAEDNPANWYHCAFVVGELACELVDAYGDDLDAWLQSSDSCGRVVR